MKLSSALAALAADPHAPTDLARVALLIARDAYTQMNPRPPTSSPASPRDY